MVCDVCAKAADHRLTRDFHCDDPGCTCGHRVERYGATTGEPADEAGRRTVSQRGG